MPTLSVLITYFNEGALLTECLKSFWEGTVRPDEILIYDDASTVSPAPFIPSEIPVRVIRGERNVGPAVGRNRLLREAKSEYVHFHDADDWVLPQWASLVRAAANPGTEVIFTEVQSYREGKLAAEKVIGLSAVTDSNSLLSFCIRNFMLVPAATFRREFLVGLKGFRESLWQSEDFDLYVRVAAAHPRMKILSASLVGIRLRMESRSRNEVETLTCALQSLIFLQREMPSNVWPELAEKAAILGSRLFQLKQRALAKEAFLFADTYGPAKFSAQRPTYRWLAKHYGQEMAEWVAFLFRSTIPSGLRRF